MKNSFHVRLMTPDFVSHFLPIAVKCETNGHLRSLAPMKTPGKAMKRSLSKTELFVSPESGFVSPHFTFRFTGISLVAKPHGSCSGRRAAKFSVCISACETRCAQGR